MFPFGKQGSFSLPSPSLVPSLPSLQFRRSKTMGGNTQDPTLVLPCPLRGTVAEEKGWFETGPFVSSWLRVNICTNGKRVGPER